MQAQLAEAGITMKIKLVDAAALAGGREQQELRDDQLPVERPARPRRQHLPVLQDGGSPLNWSGISNPKIDALLDRSREVSDKAERKKIFSELTRILHEEASMALHRAPDRAEGLQPAGPGLRARSRTG
mgnify:CR=1 FL=1